MIDHDFETQDRQKADLPDFLKTRQTEEGQENPGQDRAFNKVIHVDLINANLHLNEAYRWNRKYTVEAEKILSIKRYNNNGNKIDTIPQQKSLHEIGTFSGPSKARTPLLLVTRTRPPSTTPTRSSPTMRISPGLRPTMEKRNWVKRHKVNPNENGSVYVGTNYKDKPTHDSEK